MARNLNEMIVEFVNAWHDVVEKKLLECAESDSVKRNELEAENKKRAQSAPSSPFGFIYNWLEIGEDNEGGFYVKPHIAQKRPMDAAEHTKMRKNEYPCGADICDYFCIHPTGSFKDDSSVVRSVYRALPQLLDDKKIEEFDGCYYPSTIEYRRKAMASVLADLTQLKKDCFFAVSQTTFIVYFETAKPEFKSERKFFEDYLEKDLQDIIVHENRMVILVKGKKENSKKIGLLLRKTVKDAYKIQQAVAKKPVAKVSLVNGK